MKTGQGFLLVFSITSKSSLAELVNLREEIIRIKDDESVPIVIAGNKADLEDQRAVERAKAFSLSQRWEAPYYETSARTKSTSEQLSTRSFWRSSTPDSCSQQTSTKSLSTSAGRCYAVMTRTKTPTMTTFTTNRKAPTRMG